MKKMEFLSLALVVTFYSCNDKQSKDLDKDKNKILMKIENLGSATKFKGFKDNIEKSTIENNNFRKVLYTSKHSQLVLMSLKPNEEIGEETHAKIDQFFRFESGHGKCIIDGTEYEVKDGDVIIIPAGAKHNVINTDSKHELKLYTLYSPPNHQDGIVRKTKKEAEEKPEKFEGQTTEGL